MSISDKRSAIFVLVVAICAVSSAAPLVKSLDLDPLLIAFWRTTMVSCLLAVSLRSDHLPISRKNILLSLLAGLFLALHFWSWFSSLQRIGSLRSTTLVCLNPIWVGILELVIWRIRHQKHFWIGTTLALVGIILMSSHSSDTSNWQLEGDLLAILGGLLGAAYLLIGQKVRQEVAIQPYGFLVCTSAALCLGVLCLWFDLRFFAHPTSAWITLIALAIGPQFLGHIGLNYCLKKLPASVVSLALLLEPAGASLLSLLFLGEIPLQQEVVGAIIILLGVAIGLRSLKY